MKKKFSCSFCSATLRVDESFSGRRIRCPKCKNEIEIPNFDEPEASPVPEEPETTQTLTASADVHSADDAGFDLAGDVELSPGSEPPMEPPAPAPDDPMLRLFPDFVPNPFAVSFPLDQNFGEDDDADEEEEAPISSKMPDVDDLIK